MKKKKKTLAIDSNKDGNFLKNGIEEDIKFGLRLEDILEIYLTKDAW